MIGKKLSERIQEWEPQSRVLWAARGLLTCMVLWPATHAAMLLFQPADLKTWAAHVLLAISWFAIITTFLDIILTTDVRTEQEG